ncbi:hypothetical protein [Aliivibrio wodanis]
MIDIDELMEERKQEVIEKAKEVLARGEKIVKGARAYVEDQRNKKILH